MSLADRGGYIEARTVLRGIEEDLQSLAVTEAPDAAAPSDDVAAAAAMVAQLRLDVRNMSHGYASQQAYQGGGRAYSCMMSKSHATQRSTHVSSMPLAGPGQALAAPGPGAFSSVLGGHTHRVQMAMANMRSPRAGLPLPSLTPPSPTGARPRSASGAAPDTPTKKSRVKLFLNQVQHSFRRSSRDGEGVAAPPAGAPLRPGAVGAQVSARPYSMHVAVDRRWLLLWERAPMFVCCAQASSGVV